jgi:chemotaxis signal transduction protein
MPDHAGPADGGLRQTGDHTRLLNLRRAFDEAFARPVVDAGRPRRGWLIVTAGPDCYALPAHDLYAVDRLPTVVALPGSRRGCLGLAGIDGRLWPVFDLAVLLGTAETGPRRWIAQVLDPEPVALAFADWQRLEVREEQAVSPMVSRPGGPPLLGLLHGRDVACAVVDLGRLVRALTASAAA